MILLVNNTLHKDLAYTQATRALVDVLVTRDINHVIINNLAEAKDVIAHRGDGVSGVILGGSNTFVATQNDLMALNQIFLARCRVPILGICFGHQLMALTTGGAIERLPRRHTGWAAINTQGTDLLSRGVNRHEFYYSHQDCVVSVPGEEWKPLAVDQFNGIECVTMMRHRTRPWFGVQFHPELSGESGTVLLDNFLRLCSRSEHRNA